jgi:hypothetical protein
MALGQASLGFGSNEQRNSPITQARDDTGDIISIDGSGDI